MGMMPKERQWRLAFLVRFFWSIQKKYLLFLAFFIAAMAFFTLFGERGVVQIYQLKEEREKIRMVNARLGEENRKLAEQIGRMRSSREEVEKIAREELGLVKKGEIVYHFER
jgi:cell division protein FtsB